MPLIRRDYGPPRASERPPEASDADDVQAIIRTAVQASLGAVHERPGMSASSVAPTTAAVDIRRIIEETVQATLAAAGGAQTRGGYAAGLPLEATIPSELRGKIESGGFVGMEDLLSKPLPKDQKERAAVLCSSTFVKDFAEAFLGFATIHGGKVPQDYAGLLHYLRNLLQMARCDDSAGGPVFYYYDAKFRRAREMAIEKGMTPPDWRMLDHGFHMQAIREAEECSAMAKKSKPDKTAATGGKKQPCWQWNQQRCPHPAALCDRAHVCRWCWSPDHTAGSQCPRPPKRGRWWENQAPSTSSAAPTAGPAAGAADKKK